MPGKRKGKIDPLPEDFGTTEAAGEFWDTHDLTDYLEYLRPVDNLVFEIKKRHYAVQLDSELMGQVLSAARKKGVKIGTLLNCWIREGLQKDRNMKRTGPGSKKEAG